MKKNLLLASFILLGTLLSPSAFAARKKLPPMNEYVGQLMSRMTLQEKIGQLNLMVAGDITMEQLLLDIAAHQLASRRYALIENGSWSPVSGKKMDALLSPLKGWSAIEAPLTVKSALRPDQEAQLERLANAVAADVAKDPAADTDENGEKHRFVCKVCGYVYEGGALPEDYKCPLCGAGAEYFRQEA